MTRHSIPDTLARRWTELLIESDRCYFAAGASLHRVPGGHLAAMPGLTAFSAGAVVLLDDPGAIVADPYAWREAAVAVCAKHGAEALRFYTTGREPRLSRALAAAGLSPAREIAMAARAKRILAGGDEDDEPGMAPS